jgi:enoyl-CoA hydratase
MTDSATPQHLRVERDEAVAVVTIDRPRVLNALNFEILEDLRRTFVSLGEDDGVRAVVVTGAGEKAFVAGADVGELASLSPSAAHLRAANGQRVFDLIERLGKPVIAAVNGYALGGGCELAMACTIRIAAESARFGQPEINLGLIPGYGGTQRLTRLVGVGRALELLLSGDHISASEADRIGLVSRVVPDASLMTEAKACAAALSVKPPIAVRCILDAVHQGSHLPMTEAQALEAALFGVVAGTEDMREGTAAFLQKRKAEFKGK